MFDAGIRKAVLQVLAVFLLVVPILALSGQAASVTLAADDPWSAPGSMRSMTVPEGEPAP